MKRGRLIFNLVIGVSLLALGFKWFYQGTYRKTGDIADIYVRNAGVGLMILGGVGLIALFLRWALARGRNLPPR